MAFLALAEPGETSRTPPLLLLLSEGRTRVSEGNQEQQEQQDGLLGGVTKKERQVAQGAQETAGQAVDQATHTAEELAPGTELLSETTNQAGQTIQRTLDQTGNVLENTLDESGNLLEESPLGSITELPAEEEYTTEEGATVRTVKDESGTLISLQLGEDGSLLNLQIPPPTETEESTEESSSSYESGPQEEERPEGQEEEGPQDLSQQVQEQTLNSAQEFFGDSLGRLKGHLQDERAQFESLAEQVPDEDVQAQIQEMVDSYESLESTLDQSAEDLGLTEDVNQVLQQAQQAAGGQQEEA